MLIIEPVLPNELMDLQEIMATTFRDSYENIDGKQAIDLYIKEHFSQDRLKKLISNGKQHLYFVKIDKTIIGYIQINEPGYQSDLDEQNCIEIQRIYLNKEVQGNGYGTQMMAWVERETKNLGYSRIWLGVWKLNPRAVQFYIDQGFSIFGTHSFPMASGQDSDYLMEKILAE